MWYSPMKSLLFKLSAERAHEWTLKTMDVMGHLGVSRCLCPSVPSDPVKVMGLTFPNRVGLAAGMDKNGDALDGMGDLGFGFLELGSVTPRPQFGNPKPRMFRVPEAQGVINRLGFNNLGVHHLVENLREKRYQGIIGVNIGKNKETPNERAVDDYVYCFKAAHSVADYITVNLSSPNTPNLRDLQTPEALRTLLEPLKSLQASVQSESGRYVPLVVKLAPDLSKEQVGVLCDTLIELETDGLIGTNTTISREGVGAQWADEAGGLSGAPLTSKANEVMQWMAKAVDGRIPLIGVGGIMNPGDAEERIQSGASLVQVYSGLVYYGPNLVADCVARLANGRDRVAV